MFKSKKDGQRIDAYGDAQFVYFDNYGLPKFDKGSRNGSISDMACAKNVISVGSYNVRKHWPCLDGWVYGYNVKNGIDEYPDGEATRFSSYGTIADGRSLPNICAPGAAARRQYSLATAAIQSRQPAPGGGADLRDGWRLAL